MRGVDQTLGAIVGVECVRHAGGARVVLVEVDVEDVVDESSDGTDSVVSDVFGRVMRGLVRVGKKVMGGEKKDVLVKLSLSLPHTHTHTHTHTLLLHDPDL